MDSAPSPPVPISNRGRRSVSTCEKIWRIHTAGDEDDLALEARDVGIGVVVELDHSCKGWLRTTRGDR
jgi:hypothetical protein